MCIICARSDPRLFAHELLVHVSIFIAYSILWEPFTFGKGSFIAHLILIFEELTLLCASSVIHFQKLAVK